MLLFAMTKGTRLGVWGPSLELKEGEGTHPSHMFIQYPLWAIHWPRCLGYSGKQDRRDSSPCGQLFERSEEESQAPCSSLPCERGRGI